MPAYYNDNDPVCAAWLRELIRRGLLPPGEVDERSIADVDAADLAGFEQCHFFAGIGGWPLALRKIGWPDERPVWTGSCPCPPFSSAGRKKPCPVCNGTHPVPHVGRTGVFVCIECGHAWHADARHLWPEFWRLIRDARPHIIAGEQVASADGRTWLSGVRASLEILGYTFGAADICAAGVGAPHIRQRLWWVADAYGKQQPWDRDKRARGGAEHSDGCASRGMADMFSAGLEGFPGNGPGSVRQEREVSQPHRPTGQNRIPGGVEYPCGSRRERREASAPGNEHVGEAPERAQGEHGIGISSAHRFSEHRTCPHEIDWRDADWLFCRDGKWRPVEPGSFPLAHGVPGRVGRLRAYGNAISPEAAALFMRAYCDVRGL